MKIKKNREINFFLKTIFFSFDCYNLVVVSSTCAQLQNLQNLFTANLSQKHIKCNKS